MRTLRWTVMGTVVVIVASVALLMMFLLAQATNNPAIYERNYRHLLVANAAAVFGLLVVLGWMVWRIWQRWRKGKFGSRLLLKLALVFVLVASVPGSLLYLVAYQFVSHSIESWFDVKVERALSAGLVLGRNVLQALTVEAASKAQAAAQELGSSSAFDMGLALERLRSQQNAERLILWSQNGQRLAESAVPSFASAPSAPSAEVLAQLRQEPVVAFIEGLDDAVDAGASANNAAQPIKTTGTVHIVAYTLVRSGQFVLQDEAWVLQVVQQVPAELLESAVLVQDTNREYQTRSLARTDMQRMFIGTLTLTLFMAVFGAVLLAAAMAAQLARPLLLLAEGVRQVAEGDLRPKHIHDARDELGGLTRSFAQMTRQLAETRQALTSSLAELDASRSELQIILDNLTSGVLVLHPDGTVLLANRGACRILRMPEQNLLRQPLNQIDGLQQLGDMVQQQFESMLEQHASHSTSLPAGEEDAVKNIVPDVQGEPLQPALSVQERQGQTQAAHWEYAMELNPPAHEGLHQDVITLLLRGALLPEGQVADARLLVFEDISAIVSAQRAQAWAEVARRLAHEIKNPLTPIQLSAERLEMKLMDRLPPKEQEILQRSVHTIVDQVDAMKRLVNEFRDYARLPVANLQPVDLNALITDILQLYAADNAAVAVQADLDGDCQPVLADAQQMRQVVHNLLQNAQDAQQQAGRTDEPVRIQTQWRPATGRVRLTVCDAGPGFPEHILQRAFEPYVTTKAKGTGLGLPVVKKIADEHSARITISNRMQDGVVQGAQVSLLLPTQLHAAEESGDSAAG